MEMEELRQFLGCGRREEMASSVNDSQSTQKYWKRTWEGNDNNRI